MSERTSKPRVTVQKNTRTEVIDGNHRTRAAKEAEALEQAARDDDAARLEQEFDDLLDDIDAVLEEADISAESYVQRGGE